MDLKNIIEYLLHYGGDSIQYRVRKEILNENCNTSQMKNYQSNILEKSLIKKVIRSQQSNGLLGIDLHGCAPNALDANINVLLKNGVDLSNPLFSNLVKSINDNYLVYEFRGGKALDEGNRGGNLSVIAQSLVNLGQEENSIVKEQINSALNHFEHAIEYRSIDDFSKLSGNQRYYLNNAFFPGANHIRLLSTTYSWRNIENVKMVRKSFENCLNLMRNISQGIMFRNSKTIVGPFNYNWHTFDFKIEDVQKNSYEFVWWLNNLDNTCIYDMNLIKDSYDYLKELLISNEIYSKQTNDSIKRFKQISSIECNWRKENSIICDFYFAAIIILNKAGYKFRN